MANEEDSKLQFAFGSADDQELVPEQVEDETSNPPPMVPQGVNMQELMQGFQIQQLTLLSQMKTHQETWQKQTEKNLKEAIAQQIDETKVRIQTVASDCNSSKVELTEEVQKAMDKSTQQGVEMTNMIAQEFRSNRDLQIGEQSRLRNTLTETTKELANLLVNQHGKVVNSMKDQNQDLQAVIKGNQDGFHAVIQKLEETVVSSVQEVNKNITYGIKELTDAVVGMTKSLATSQEKMTKSLTGMTSDLKVHIQAVSERTDEHIRAVLDGQDGGARHHFDTFTAPPTTGSRMLQLSNRSQMKHEGSFDRKTEFKKGGAGSETASTTESSSQTDDSDSEVGSGSHVSRSKSRGHANNSRLSKFTGKEKWSIWYKRFKIGVKGLHKSERLDALLGLMHGDAAEFVFDQLPQRKLLSYRALVKELGTRYRRVENPRTYGAMFSNREQGSKESVEEFAAELKRLYDKGHPDRDAKTRREDLLRRFLDGLKDEDTASQVEFVRTLGNIDEAVDAVVNYQELHGKRDKDKKDKKASKTRRVVNSGDDTSDSDDEVRAVGRGPGRPAKAKQPKVPDGGQQPQVVTDANATANGTQQVNLPPQGPAVQGSQVNNSSQDNTQNQAPTSSQQPQNNNFQGGQKFGNQDNQNRQGFNNQGRRGGNWQNRNFGNQSYQQGRNQGYQQSGNQGYQQSGNQGYQRSGNQGYQQGGNSGYRDFFCFKCGGPNHLARFCHATAVMGQVQVPPGAQLQSFPTFQNMFPSQVSGQHNVHQTSPQLTTTDGISQVGLSPQGSAPSTWGVTGTTVVPPGTALPGVAPQYVPTTSQGN